MTVSLSSNCPQLKRGEGDEGRKIATDRPIAAAGTGVTLTLVG